MNDYEDKILIWFLQNNESSIGKFNPWIISKELDIPVKNVITTINQLQKKNLITIQCPICREKALLELKNENK